MTGHGPAEFYSSTFDEVLLVIQGTIDRMRIERRNAWLVRCSLVSKPGVMTDALPLPYDDELEENDAEENAALYEQGKLIRMPGVKYAE